LVQAILLIDSKSDLFKGLFPDSVNRAYKKHYPEPRTTSRELCEAIQHKEKYCKQIPLLNKEGKLHVLLPERILWTICVDQLFFARAKTRSRAVQDAGSQVGSGQQDAG